VAVYLIQHLDGHGRKVLCAVLVSQTVNREREQAAGERDEWSIAARSACRAAATSEQLARSHAQELSESRKAYQVTCLTMA
jgi:hypothetical protein